MKTEDEINKKIVIKNCPCYFIDDGYCSAYEEHCSCIDKCLVKNIINICQDAIIEMDNIDYGAQEFDACDYVGKCNKHNLTKNIIELMDMQEMKDEKCE